jgi:NagD protein
MPSDGAWPDRAVPTAVRERLRSARGFVFDLDGTLVLTDQRNNAFTPLPGAVAMTRWLAARGLPFVAFTNGTTKTARGYAQALAEAGFGLNDGSVLTPAVSAAELFTRRRHRRVMALGGDGLATPLREAGIEVAPPARGRPVDAVLAGWYREFSMDALEAACEAVWQGARLYSCSQSVFFATAEGKAIGTSRAISAMIRSVTGCRVQVVGKPSLHALRSAARRLGVRPAELAVVGDDPELEVPMAHGGKPWPSRSGRGSAPQVPSTACAAGGGPTSCCAEWTNCWTCARPSPAPSGSPAAANPAPAFRAVSGRGPPSPIRAAGPPSRAVPPPPG